MATSKMDVKEITQIAVLDTKVSTLTGNVNEIKADVKEVKTIMTGYADNFVTKAEFAAFKRQYWLSHALTSILTAVIVGLIAYYINHN